MNIDKLGWIYIKNRKMLNVRSKGKTVFYTPGGKREGNETDQEALIRELKEELNIDLKTGTIEYLETFEAQADAKPLGTMVRIRCYKSDFGGVFTPSNEIEELGWQTSKDMGQLSATGKLIMQWLHEKNLVD
jgi:8-oxo-dGTP pyrophosphatase MutT (NUDIX family)